MAGGGRGDKATNSPSRRSGLRGGGGDAIILNEPKKSFAQWKRNKLTFRSKLKPSSHVSSPAKAPVTHLARAASIFDLDLVAARGKRIINEAIIVGRRD